MANASAHMYRQGRLQSAMPHEVMLAWKITAAKTISAFAAEQPALTAFDAIAAQATIDNYLGTSSEFTIAKFDGTAMGTDAFAAIVAMEKEVASLDAIHYRRYSAAGALVTELYLQASSSLTDSSLTSQAALGASGNMAARIIDTGLDAATSGTIDLRFYARFK